MIGITTNDKIVMLYQNALHANSDVKIYSPGTVDRNGKIHIVRSTEYTEFLTIFL